MAFECTACGKQFERKMRRPMGCLSPDSCEIVAIEITRETPESNSGLALLTQVDAIQKAREQMGAELPVAQIAQPLGVSLVIGETRIPLENFCVLGRQGTVVIEQFVQDRSISRRHAELYLKADAWCIRNLAISGSPLYLNGERIAPNDERLLALGVSQLMLGDHFVANLLVE